MRRLVSALFAVAIVASSPLAMARGGHSSYGGHHSGHSGSGHGSHHYYGHGGHHHDSHKVIGVPRNSHGRIKRSPEAKAHFRRAIPVLPPAEVPEHALVTSLITSIHSNAGEQTHRAICNGKPSKPQS